MVKYKKSPSMRGAGQSVLLAVACQGDGKEDSGQSRRYLSIEAP